MNHPDLAEAKIAERRALSCFVSAQDLDSGVAATIRQAVTPAVVRILKDYRTIEDRFHIGFLIVRLNDDYSLKGIATCPCDILDAEGRVISISPLYMFDLKEPFAFAVSPIILMAWSDAQWKDHSGRSRQEIATLWTEAKRELIEAIVLSIMIRMPSFNGDFVHAAAAATADEEGWTSPIALLFDVDFDPLLQAHLRQLVDAEIKAATDGNDPSLTASHPF